jgi:hypothetical protein
MHAFFLFKAGNNFFICYLSLCFSFFFHLSFSFIYLIVNISILRLHHFRISHWHHVMNFLSLRGAAVVEKWGFVLLTVWFWVNFGFLLLVPWFELVELNLWSAIRYNKILLILCSATQQYVPKTFRCVVKHIATTFTLHKV